MKPQKNFAPLCKRKIFTCYFVKRKKSRRNNKNFFTEIIKQDPKCFSCLWRNFFFLRPWTKVPYFIFSTGKLIFYTFLGKINWMNEKSLFFFRALKKKKRFVIEWMNDMWTLAEKKKQKNAKISEKKSNPFC